MRITTTPLSRVTAYLELVDELQLEGHEFVPELGDLLVELLHLLVQQARVRHVVHLTKHLHSNKPGVIMGIYRTKHSRITPSTAKRTFMRLMAHKHS